MIESRLPDTNDAQHSTSNAQPLTGYHFLNFMSDVPDPDAILAFAHVRAPQRPVLRRLPGRIRSLAQRILPQAASGTAWATAAVIRYRFPHHGRLIPLAHMQRAVVNRGGIDLHFADRVIHLPGLCRPQPFANVINGVVSARYEPSQPFRPTCRSCRHQRNGRCGAQPPVITPTECCSNTAHLDWCPAYRQNM